MFQRIGEVGALGAARPVIGPTAQIRATDRGERAIVDDGRTVATYRAREVRLSVLWKAEVFADHEAEKKAISDRLSLDRVMEILTNDLRRRGIEYVEPSDPLKSDAWVETLRRTYYTSPGGGRL